MAFTFPNTHLNIESKSKYTHTHTQMEAHPHRIVHLLIPICFKLLLSWGITPVGGYYFSSSSLSDSVIHTQEHLGVVMIHRETRQSGME